MFIQVQFIQDETSTERNRCLNSLKNLVETLWSLFQGQCLSISSHSSLTSADQDVLTSQTTLLCLMHKSDLFWWCFLLHMKQWGWRIILMNDSLLTITFFSRTKIPFCFRTTKKKINFSQYTESLRGSNLIVKGNYFLLAKMFSLHPKCRSQIN